MTIYEKVATNENTPAAILEILAKNRNPYVRQAVAENRNTPATALETLAKDNDPGVLNSLVRNENTPVSIREELGTAENWSVRYAMAGNKNTPENVLEKLAKDEDRSIRFLVARNKNTPATALETLAKDEEYLVRMEVAENKNTPANVLEDLAKEEYLLALQMEGYQIISDNIFIPMPDELHPEHFPLDIGKIFEDREENEHVFSLHHLSDWNELEEFVNKGLEIDGHSCVRVNAWQTDKAHYDIGQDVEDTDWYYAEVFDVTDGFKGTYTYEFDRMPTEQEVIGRHVDKISEMAIDQHERESGADGNRVFPNLDAEPISIFSIRMENEERFFENTSGLDVEGLCKAYAECDKPFVEMGKYGEWIDEADYAYIQQGHRLDFSIEFNEDTNRITIFDGENFEDKGLRATLFPEQAKPEDMIRTDDFDALHTIIQSAVAKFQDKYPQEEYEYPPLIEDLVSDFENRAKQMISDCLTESGDTDLENMLIDMHDLTALDAVRDIKFEYHPIKLLKPVISADDLKEAKAEKDVRDAAAPKQGQKQKAPEHGLE